MIGKRIQDWRRQEGLSTQALAELCGIPESRSLLSKIEHGAREPGLGTSIALAKGMKVPLRRVLSKEASRQVLQAAKMLGLEKPKADAGA